MLFCGDNMIWETLNRQDGKTSSNITGMNAMGDLQTFLLKTAFTQSTGQGVCCFAGHLLSHITADGIDKWHRQPKWIKIMEKNLRISQEVKQGQVLLPFCLNSTFVSRWITRYFLPLRSCRTLRQVLVTAPAEKKFTTAFLAQSWKFALCFVCRDTSSVYAKHRHVDQFAYFSVYSQQTVSHQHATHHHKSTAGYKKLCEAPMAGRQQSCSTFWWPWSRCGFRCAACIRSWALGSFISQGAHGIRMN